MITFVFMSACRILNAVVSYGVTVSGVMLVNTPLKFTIEPM